MKNLEKQGYRLTGKHSAVKICNWTRESIRDKGICYKQEFYGIKSHECCQMTPCLTCNNSCTFCWRSTKNLTGTKLEPPIDTPEQIINNCIEQQKQLLIGFKGYKNTNQKKLQESFKPSLFAISLTGEPTIYPYLKELIQELKKRKIKSFLVTNGQFPDKLKDLNPTQLYLSLDAPNKEIYKKLDKPLFKDYWERLLKSLDILSKTKTRTCIRITAIKEINMCNLEQYAELIKIANPKFVEIKGYMWIGESRKILKKENMPFHEDVLNFSEELAKILNWKVIKQKKESRAVLLMKEDKDRLVK
jgi:tRNA wybutosine-synthesizing protein 1